MESRDAFEVHEYHLDVNRHVNNGQYVQMAAEYLPEDFDSNYASDLSSLQDEDDYQQSDY